MIKLEHIYYILEIERAGSISKAADKLYLSQPYLSQILNNIENRLGLKLFYRTSKGVKLSPAGAEFIKLANKITKNIRDIENLSKKFNSENQEISIASMPSFTMIHLVSSFRKTVGELKPKFVELPNAEVLKDIEQKRHNIGLYYIDSREYQYRKNELWKKGINFNPLIDEPLCAVVNCENVLANKNSVSLKELENYNFLAESIKIENLKEKHKNILAPEIFKVSDSGPSFNNNRSLFYYLTKNAESYCIGQRALNFFNPFYESGQIKYLPIDDLNISLVTGYLTHEDKESSHYEEEFINYIEEFFTKYRNDKANRDFVIDKIFK
ncbi:MAG: LysR family transcriptional regulator [Tissierellia bacterium]|nr:LysR family transcriptional regulator [Tissierellia bacterium]